MWCRNCNIETNENVCPVCGEVTYINSDTFVEALFMDTEEAFVRTQKSRFIVLLVRGIMESDTNTVGF